MRSAFSLKLAKNSSSTLRAPPSGGGDGACHRHPLPGVLECVREFVFVAKHVVAVVV